MLAPGYDQAHEAVGPLAFGALGYGAAAILLTGISLAKRTLYVAGLSTVAAVVNVVLNLLLIPPLGIVGAGLASASGYAALAALYYWAAQRVYPTPFEPGRVLAILALAIAAACAALLPVDGAAGRRASARSPSPASSEPSSRRARSGRPSSGSSGASPAGWCPATPAARRG